MKISLKKLLFVVLTVFSIIFIGACGKSKINKEEVIGKFIEASKNMKSADMVVDMKMTQKGNKEAINMSIDSTIILEPLEMRLEMTVPNQNTKMQIYIKNNFMYVLNPITNQWVKQALDDLMGEQFKGYMTNSDYIYDVMKDNIDKIDIDEEDGNYIISISKETEFLKEAMKKQLSNMNTTGNQIGDQIEIDNIAVKYIVDKKTYLAKVSAISFDMELNGQKISMELGSKMSNVNEIKEITLPEEVKNSKEIAK